ncbi:hypothetical protein JMM63_19115 [Rhodovulum sulfidophilum]|uniref:hypothetical protein n=1 Tax=Rhodovulum sulfidophilum TaxID=35806 RepID=UPI001921915C|nr:hypothetical protein [Rhodovulum sulfidophilum]MBL3597636.1 hypothetical protein [Rhodovulum sulfidophilum]
MVAPAVPAGGAIYVGGAALAYGLMYAISPEFRAANESLASAMAQGANDAYQNVEDLIFGEEDDAAGSTPTTRAGTDTATGEARCPALPYWHFTDPGAGKTILAVRAFIGPRNHFANRPWGPRTIFHTVFISNPIYIHKPHFFVQIMADCTVPLAPGQAWGDIVQEFIHTGRLNERPPYMTIVAGATNVFPEYPGFEEFPIR